MKQETGKEEFVKWFSELSNKDVAIAGGKGASLAEMYNIKMPVPPGFIVTAQAYQYFIEKAGLNEKIKRILDGFDIEDTEKLEFGTKEIREMISNAEMPDDLADEIIDAYNVLDADKETIRKAKGSAMDILKTGHEPPFVAVRSSATAEDLADASFAGQQESFLNVKGRKELIQKIKECFASLFTARATYYRKKKGFKHMKVFLAVVVQKMIDAEKSGVMFSVNPISNHNSILIEAVFGLGEGIVSGKIKPDSYVVDANLEDFKILESNVPVKKIAIVKTSSGKNEISRLTEEKGKQQVLNNYEIKRLAQYGKQLEEHYGKPQDIEFAIEKDEIFIVQSRPITTKVVSRKEIREVSGEVLFSGLAASPGIASGVVKIIKEMPDLEKIKKGDVLVTKMTNPDMVVTMQKSAAIVTDEGGITSHASIVSREMGIPAVVGTGIATEKLEDGIVVTVDGNTGKIYEGRRETKLAEVNPIVETKRTKIKVIVDLPEFAERAAQSGAKGIGLTRIEGIIAGSGKHPIAFAKEGKTRDYIEILYNGIKKIAIPFEEIWVRSSDIRSDEYRNLEGAPKEIEGNPMLGFHGIRFGLKNKDILAAELNAIKEVADDFPQKKIGIMFPQVISVDEVKQAKAIAKELGMPKNVRIGIMVETPAAVQIINELCEEGIDFISFGTNDLTQFTLAIDRNNADVQYIYDEMNPAVLNSLAYVIRRCRRYKVESSICGQAGSREDMVRFLVSQGIDSISVNADAAQKISKLVAELESEKQTGEKKEVILSKMKGWGELKDESKGRRLKGDEKETEEKPIKREQEEEKFQSPIESEGEESEEQRKEAKESENHIPVEKTSIGLIGDKDNNDIEEIILKQLEEGNKEIKDKEQEESSDDEDKNEEEDYMPGPEKNESKEDTPSLNDSIPIDSNLIEDALNEKEEQYWEGEETKNEKEPELAEDKEWEHPEEAQNLLDEDKKVDIF